MSKLANEYHTMESYAEGVSHGDRKRHASMVKTWIRCPSECRKDPWSDADIAFERDSKP